ncbi:MAG: hypothetical protein ACK5BU_04330, partial [Bacteroidota bacterium]
PIFVSSIDLEKVNNSVYPIGQSYRGRKESANPDLGAAKIGEICLLYKCYQIEMTAVRLLF